MEMMLVRMVEVLSSGCLWKAWAEFAEGLDMEYERRKVKDDFKVCGIWRKFTLLVSSYALILYIEYSSFNRLP